MRILLGPLSLAIGTFISVLYFSFTNNFLKSLLIGIIAPVIVNIILILYLKFWNRAVDSNQPANPMSRMLGGIFNFTWSGILYGLVIMLIALVPPQIVNMKNFKNDVERSFCYQFIRSAIKLPVPTKENVEKTLNVFNAEFIDKIRSSEEFTSIMEDEKIKSLLSNQETRQQIQKKDIVKLLSNPEFLGIFKDKELIRKIMALNTKIFTQEHSGNQTQMKVYTYTP